MHALRSRWHALILTLGLGLAALCLPAWSQAVLPVPALSGHVIDQTGTLTAEQQQALEARLTAFEQAKGTQLVVLMVPTTQPEDISSYANRIGNSWKIGRKGIGDGLLLVVAKSDRKLRIEVAKTLEGAIPDLAASQIIEDTITPRFKQGDFAGGISAGIEQLIGLVNGEKLPEPAAARSGGSSDFRSSDLLWLVFFGVAVGGSLARSIFGRKLGALVTGGGAGVVVWLFTASLIFGVLAALLGAILALFVGPLQLLSSGGWTSGRSGGGGGGGGFSSGGGGDFGGGGSSGSW